MNLKLEVISANGSGLGAGTRKVFGTEGGRIGRADDCDWVLPSPNKYVSRHHATILFANGSFHIRAEGQNGVAVNSPGAWLPSGTPSALRNGDRMFIDEYEIIASVVSESARPALIVGDPFADEADSHLAVPVAEFQDGDSLDPLSQLPSAPTRSRTLDLSYATSARGSVLNDPFLAPPPVPAAAAPAGPNEAAAIPSNWNETTYGHAPYQKPVNAPVRQPAGAAPRPPAVPAARPAPPRAAPPPAKPDPIPRPAAGLDMNAMLRAAGVDPQSVPAEMAATLGQILKLVVQGTIDTLRARDEVKSQFRLAVTRVRVSDNNPLSFAVDADDAINSLLSRRNPAFLPPLEAFQRAFDDIRSHQMAMLAGMRAGFENLLARFDPEQLQQDFDRQVKRGGLLAAVSTPKYWDLYADYFARLGGDRDDAFRRLFGEEFALAYEKQITLLKRSHGQKIP